MRHVAVQYLYAIGVQSLGNCHKIVTMANVECVFFFRHESVRIGGADHVHRIAKIDKRFCHLKRFPVGRMVIRNGLDIVDKKRVGQVSQQYVPPSRLVRFQRYRFVMIKGPIEVLF